VLPGCEKVKNCHDKAMITINNSNITIYAAVQIIVSSVILKAGYFRLHLTLVILFGMLYY